MSRHPGWRFAACAWLAILATAPLAAAQEPGDPEAPAEAQPIPADPQDGVSKREEMVYRWVFSADTPDTARSKVGSALARDIGRYDTMYGLTPGRKKKLELAGRRDIKRFFDQVEALKAEYRRVQGDWNQVGEQLFALQRMQNHPHSEILGDDSMVAKTLRSILSPEQTARYEKAVYRKRVEWAAGLLHSRLVLSPEQRRGLVDLVVGETPPLRRYGSFDYDAIMFQISRLPRERLRAVLDESQCRELALRFEQARRLEGVLRSEGYLAGARGDAEKASSTRTARAGRD